MIRLDAYADSPRDALVLLHLLALLHLGPGAVINLLHAHVLLTTAELWCIDRDEETFDATRLCMLNVFPGDLAVPVDVELNEEGLAVGLRVDNVIERTRSESSNLWAL